LASGFGRCWRFAVLFFAGACAFGGQASAQPVASAAVGFGHALFVKTDGTLWAMGNNASGQLGDGTMLNRKSPVQVAAGAVSVVADNSQTVFVNSDGEVFVMGYFDALGDLYHGTTILPLPVAMSGVATVAMSSGHTMFVKTDGSLWAVGWTSRGQLGNGPASYPPFQLTPVQVATAVASVAVSTDHTLFVKRDGTLWAAGWNASGQLGDGTTTDRFTPVLVAGGVASVAAGPYHTLFVKTDGTLWATGWNGDGQLGDGTTVSRTSPIQVATGVASVAAGDNHTLFVKTDGTLWAVGSNQYGQLGDGTTVTIRTPAQVASGVASVATGSTFTLFVKTDGTLWAVGRNYYGQLGDGTTTSRQTPLQVVPLQTVPVPPTVTTSGGTTAFAEGRDAVSVPVPIDPALTLASSTLTLARATVEFTAHDSAQDLIAFANDGATMGNIAATAGSFVRILTLTSAGATATLAQWQAALRAVTYTNRSDAPSTQNRTVDFIVSDGTTNSVAASKTISVTAVNDTPTDLTLLSATVSQSAGVNATVGALITADPDSATFTYALVGGAGSADNSLFNLAGAVLRANNAGSLAAGAYTVRVQTSDGSGGVFSRALAVSVIDRSAPAAVLTVAAGSGHTVFIQTDGTVRAMGRNHRGQLGDGTTIDRLAPVTMTAGGHQVSAGASHTMLVKNDGTLWAVGADDSGQLCDDSRVDRSTPVQVAGSVALVSAGALHNAAITFRSALLTGGSNGYGKLDDFIAVGSSLHQVESEVTAVATGENHTLFVKTDGTLWAVGKNSSGQLGNGTTTRPDFRVQVAQNATSVAAGSDHSLFIKSDGTLCAMGRNDWGQLGDGTTVDRSTPVPVASGVASVSAGYDHTVFVKADGTLWAVGRNNHGQLGDSFAADRTTAVQVASEVAVAAAGDYHTMFVRTDGTLWAMGANAFGQLGDGTTTDRNYPVQVAGPPNTVATRVVNFSVRTTAGTGDRTLIVGLVVNGAASKTLLLRGLGPALLPQGVTNALADPRLRLLNARGAELDANDDWGGGATLTARFAAVGATPLPAGSSDAALYNALPAGLYSFHLFPHGAGTGVALAEVYDADNDSSAASVVNISARTQVGTGENVLIAGFVIAGSAPKTLLLRGLGPTLAAQGVTGALADPQLWLFRGATLLGGNDDWAGATVLKDAFALVGAGPLAADASKDAALLVTLQPGVYSAQVSGVAGTTGVGLVEIFLLP
jgi:alpha-tubulin suppressor-like RCC1 family protein